MSIRKMTNCFHAFQINVDLIKVYRIRVRSFDVIQQSTNAI